MYPIRPIDRLQAEDIEYLGTKRKFWFTTNGQRFLFFRDKNYPATEDRKYGIREYTVDAVARVVSILEPPSSEWMGACRRELPHPLACSSAT